MPRLTVPCAALLALALLSASASSYFRFDPRAAAGLVATDDSHRGTPADPRPQHRNR